MVAVRLAMVAVRPARSYWFSGMVAGGLTGHGGGQTGWRSDRPFIFSEFGAGPKIKGVGR